MLPYIIFYFLVFLLSFKIKKNKISIFDFLLICILILFSALRVGIGTDYKMYYVIFKNFITVSQSATSRTGVGYSVLMYLFKNILHLNYQFLIAFAACVTILCLYYYFKKNSDNPGKSILLYVSIGLYVSAFNGFRQNMSIAIALVGLTLFQNNKKIPSIFLLIIASLLHSSTLILILCYYLFVYKKITIKPYIVFVISIFLYLSYNFVFPILISKFAAYSGYIETNFNTTPGIGTFIIVLAYSFLYFIYFQKRKNDFSEKENLYLNVFGVAIMAMSLQLHNWLFSRILDIFIPFIPILLAKAYTIECGKKSGKIFSLIFHVLCFIYFCVYVYSFGEVVPYSSILTQGGLR